MTASPHDFFPESPPCMGGYELHRLKTKKSRLKLGTRKIADRAQGIIRKSLDGSKGRHHDRVAELRDRIAALRAALADQNAAENGASTPLSEGVVVVSEIDSFGEYSQVARALDHLKRAAVRKDEPPIAPQAVASRKKGGRKPGHEGTIVSIDDQHIAKLISMREAEAYRRFSVALEGAVCGCRPASDFSQERLDEETRASLTRLEGSRPDKVPIILNRVGAHIRSENKRELDIKLGKTVSYTLTVRRQREENGQAVDLGICVGHAVAFCSQSPLSSGRCESAWIAAW